MAVDKQIGQGVAWVTLEKIIQQVLAFGIFIVLARLIGPQEFGLYSLCYVFIHFTAFVTGGLADGVVSRKDHDDRDLSTLFWVVLGIGIALSLIIYLLAEPFAYVMQDERLTPLMQAMAIQPVLIALVTIPTARIQANMDFKIFTLRSLVSTIGAGIVGIILALQGAGAFSMLVQQIVQLLIVNGIIWSAVKWKPSFLFDYARLQPMLKPGVSMSGSLLINFLEMFFPRVLMGLFLGPVAVGYYALMVRIWFALREVIIQPLSTVFFSAFSTVQDDPQKMKQLLEDVIGMLGFILFPATFGIITLAPDLIKIFFGTAWLPAVIPLQLYFLSVLGVPFLILLRDFMRARQKTKEYVKAQLWFFGATLLAMFALIPFGLLFYCMGLALIAILLFPVVIQKLAKASGYPLWPALVTLRPLLFASLLMAAGVDVFEYAINPQGIGGLITSILIGIFLYAIACHLLARRTVTEIYKNLRVLLPI